MSAFANHPVDVAADPPVVAARVVAPVAPAAERAVAVAVETATDNAADTATDSVPAPAAKPAPEDEPRPAAPDTALVSALHRVADSFERVAESLDADRCDRGARLDDVESLLREFMSGLRPTAVPPVVIGGSIEPPDALSGDAAPVDAKPGPARKKRPRAKVARDEIDPPEGQIDLSLAELEGNR
ncbi:MAG: hypothetical protein QOH10_1149 [Actinomycetota bacterium]|nr:hypothetical protein [Actinomycetota bacterium]